MVLVTAGVVVSHSLAFCIYYLFFFPSKCLLGRLLLLSDSLVDFGTALFLFPQHFPFYSWEEAMLQFHLCLGLFSERGRKKRSLTVMDKRRKQTEGWMVSLTSTLNQKHTQTTSTHCALLFLIITTLFMNHLWLCYLVNYVLEERAWYDSIQRPKAATRLSSFIFYLVFVKLLMRTLENWCPL